MIKIKSNKEHTIPLRKGSKGKSELVAVALCAIPLDCSKESPTGTGRRLLKNLGSLRW